jgi:hypothetical protein
MPLTEQDWQIRYFIYTFFVNHTRPPSCLETASHFGIDEQAAIEAYQRLHQHHQLFLKPGTHDVLIANPLSAVPTLYKVSVNGRKLWANCAWDSLGIPVMLHSDAEIEALDLFTKEVIRYRVVDGQLEAPDYFVHYALPVSRWYDDLVDT